ncbi:MAG: zinc-binding dehydrogenase [Alphaproteobacteria bacterium]|nr:zinc-binding dehydrogenase [Alphaproteobacteria bacterium]
MKAAIFHEFGTPDVLRYEDVPDPVPGPGELVVKVHAVTINRVLDCRVREGHPSQARRNVKPPHVLGVDPTGVVTALGEGVTAPPVGARVACISQLPTGGMLGLQCWGGNAEYVKVPASIVSEIPDGLDFAEAGAVLRHGPMAHYLLFDLAKLQPGESVLVMGAAGGLGATGIQICKAFSARVICAAGSDERVQVGLDFGADEGVNYNRTDLTEAAMAFTDGKGVNVVFENISNPQTWPAALASMAMKARMVTAGAHGGGKVELDCGILYHRNLHIMGGTGNTQQNVADTVALARAGKLHAKIEKVLPLSQAAEGHRIIEAGVPLGKIVLDPTLG